MNFSNKSESIQSQTNIYTILDIVQSFNVLFCISDFICLFILFKSRSKLVNVEFYILFVYIMCVIAYKFLFSSLYIVIMIHGMNVANNLVYNRLSFLSFLAIMFATNMNLFFLSLFHLSSLKRTKFFLQLFNYTHNSRIFIIFSSLINFSSILINSILLFLIESENSLNGLYSYLEFYLIAIERISLSFLPILVYVMSIFVILFERILNRNKDNRFKKNLILFLKFSSFAVYNSLWIIPMGLSQFFDQLCGQKCSISNNVIYYFGYAFYLFQSIFLVLIHNVLKATFMQILVLFKNAM